MYLNFVCIQHPCPDPISHFSQVPDLTLQPSFSAAAAHLLPDLAAPTQSPGARHHLLLHTIFVPAGGGTRPAFVSAPRGSIDARHGLFELPPSADLLPDGTIQLPHGVGEPGVAYTPSSLLAFLAKHNRLFGFTKGNGWQAVSYNGKRLQELRGGGGRV